MDTLYVCSPSLELLDGPECKLRAPEKHSGASLGSALPMKEAACVKSQRQRLAKGIHELWKGTVETLKWAWVCGGGGRVRGCRKAFVLHIKAAIKGFKQRAL